ncbi:hypothetical protein Pmani_004294 [Petrolisthes manimaculis]|uniref:Uncharacterized protein n=1 Tax=Petrolisthes manimaculis TaxID=1843537 RepID=A0AAE1QE08_9EUCA|nr:hypothetical protein Pmani_004294 [Petrolisthes manimaculis]
MVYRCWSTLHYVKQLSASTAVLHSLQNIITSLSSPTLCKKTSILTKNINTCAMTNDNVLVTQALPQLCWPCLAFMGPGLVRLSLGSVIPLWDLYDLSTPLEVVLGAYGPHEAAIREVADPERWAHETQGVVDVGAGTLGWGELQG